MLRLYILLLTLVVLIFILGSFIVIQLRKMAWKKNIEERKKIRKHEEKFFSELEKTFEEKKENK